MAKDLEARELSIRVTNPEKVAKLHHGAIVPPEVWEPIIGGPTLKKAYAKALESQVNSNEKPTYLMFFGSAVQVMLYGTYQGKDKRVIAGRYMTDTDVYGSNSEVTAAFNNNHSNTGRLPWTSCKDYTVFRDQYATTLNYIPQNGSQRTEEYLNRSQSPEDFLAATAMFKHETVSLLMTKTETGNLEVRVYDPERYLDELKIHMRLTEVFHWSGKRATQGMPLKENTTGIKSQLLRAWAHGDDIPVDLPLGWAMNITKLMQYKSLYDMGLPLESDLLQVYTTALNRLFTLKDPDSEKIQKTVLRNSAMDFIHAAMISANDAFIFTLTSLPLGRLFSTEIGKIFGRLYTKRSAPYEEKISHPDYVFANTALSRMLNMLISIYDYKNVVLNGMPEPYRYVSYTPNKSYKSMNELFAIMVISLGWDDKNHGKEIQKLVDTWNSYGFEEYITYGWRIREKRVKIAVAADEIEKEVHTIKTLYSDRIFPKLPNSVR